jgi:hypothetical protein
MRSEACSWECVTEVRPSLRDLNLIGLPPGVETPGYSRLSLRDKWATAVRDNAKPYGATW